MYNLNGSDVTVMNSIFYGNYPDQIYNADTSTCTVTYSNVEGGYTGTTNILGYVGFIDSLNDLHLNSSSSCIDAANGSVAPPADKDGNERYDHPSHTNVTGTYVDMGAYEYWP